MGALIPGSPTFEQCHPDPTPLAGKGRDKGFQWHGVKRGDAFAFYRGDIRVEIDGFRDTPIGPHPIANVLVIFKPDQFDHVVPYLMLNRDGLDVLVHPLTAAQTRSATARVFVGS